MALFTTNTANLLSPANTLKSFDRSFNTFPSAKQLTCSHPVMRLKLNRVITIRAAMRDENSSSLSSCFPSAKSLYDVLCVPESAEMGEVKKAYREKVRIYHPDVCPAAEKEKCGEMFMLVQEAYETLSDPMLRADYDLDLRFSPGVLFSQKRNVKESWADQMEGLRVKSRSSERKTWGAKLRRSREEMGMC